MTYEPRVAEQLDNIEESWGEAERNREQMIRTGIKSLDQLFYGIDTKGELIAIQGKEKHRKTTLAINWIVSMALDEHNRKQNIVIDTLESQMDYIRYRDSIIAMLMTKYMLEETHHKSHGCPICKGDCGLIGKLSPEFFKYRRDKLNKQQQKDFSDALSYAITVLKRTNISVYDGRIDQGNTRNLEDSVERWSRLAGEGLMDLLFIDHSQQYHIKGVSSGDHFSHLNIVVDAVSTAITQYSFPVILLSQVSKNSQLSASNPAEFQASGGAKLSQEASVVLSTSKDSNSSFTATVGVSRVSGIAKVTFKKVDPSSGYIIDRDAPLENI